MKGTARADSRKVDLGDNNKKRHLDGEATVQYRNFGKKISWKVSALGFGVMRLPVIGNDPAKIDEPEASKMIRYAIDHGVNYLDTAYTYHGGKSESLLGNVLQNGYREKVRLATKMPTWLVKSRQDMDKYLRTQISRLKVDYIDFYLLHGLDNERWKKLSELDVTSWAEKKIDEGIFHHLGFSFHDDFDAFRNIIDSYDGWTFCQIQHNYADPEYQAGTRGLKYAASKGLGVVIMEPIGGGTLAINPLVEVQAVWNEADVKRSQAEWALQWVWNQPEVSVALSGMSTLDQVIENVNSASRSRPNKLSEKELELINRVAQKYRELGFIGCTGCRYCLPCDQGVNIPQIIALMNEFYARRSDDGVKKKYWSYITPESQAKRCIRCGKCEEICPQKLPIRQIMSRAAMVFERSRGRRRTRS
jgi:predicted aldo/keto reductase-like oxidoreductase